jgi:hypothetical protein
MSKVDEAQERYAKYERFKNRLRIDRSQLDNEVAGQARLHQDICEEHVCLKSQLAEVELHLAEVQARVHMEVEERLKQEARDALEADKAAAKKAGTSFRRTKPEEVLSTSVRKAVLADKEVHAVTRKCETLRESRRLWEALRESSTQRSFMFKELVDLEICGMTSSETVSPSPLASGKSSRTDAGSSYEELKAEQSAARRTRSQGREDRKATTKVKRQRSTL